MEKYYKRLYQKLTIGSSLICIIFFGLIAVEEQFLLEWKQIQNEYKSILLSKAQNEQEKELAGSFKIEIKQVILDDFSRVDRCVSCHNGIENPAMADEAIPHANHSGDYLKHHPVEQFGCTVCHGGQGRALTSTASFASSEDIHWEYPVIPLDYVQSSCGKCHLSLFDPDYELPGAEDLLIGRDLFLKNGCLGCHKVRGVGGSTGLELTNSGAKTKHEYPFENVSGERTTINWLREHFLEPGKVSPGSVMPKVEISGSGLDNLIAFTMSLYYPAFPPEYYTLENVKEFKGGRRHFSGDEAFSVLCSTCHGENGEGKDYREFERAVPALSNQAFLAAASNAMIKFTITKGRGGIYMSPWGQDNGGLYSDEIDNIVQKIKNWKMKPPEFRAVMSAPKDLNYGKILYRSRCGTCHGDTGEGGIGPSLNQQEFLALASDEFLYKTIAHGRENTAMISWSSLSAREMSGVIAYVKSWRKVPLKRLSTRTIQGNIENGEFYYAGHCAGCHGIHGQGSVGSALFNKDFLAAASDEFIYNSMSRGRTGSAMRSFAKELQGMSQLNEQEMHDIVAFIRSRENVEAGAIYTNITAGTPAIGKEMYDGMCAGCHGVKGEGKHGPALSSQEFLNAATDGFLQATIALGRDGTAMRSWAKGAQGYSELTAVQINDIVSYIRTWQKVIISNNQ